MLDQYLHNNSENKCPLHGLMENKATENVTDTEKGFKMIWIVKENQAGSLQREIGHPGEALTIWKALHRSCSRTRAAWRGQKTHRHVGALAEVLQERDLPASGSRLLPKSSSVALG